MEEKDHWIEDTKRLIHMFNIPHKRIAEKACYSKSNITKILGGKYKSPEGRKQIEKAIKIIISERLLEKENND